MFENLKRIAKKLELKPERAEAEDEKGKKIPILALHHGTHNLFAIEQAGYTLIVYPMDVDPKDAALLAKEPPEIQQTLFAILKREMAEGRSGFLLQLDETKKPPEVRRISLEQKIVIQNERPETVQRVADGIQELVVTAIRCQLVLGQAFQDVRTAAQTSASTYHAGMYA
ncbi:MAG TPA: hypothetical protein VK189_03820 [Thermoplasmata archaeon]|nr:hypothetical protein [Thermoplasmata archaeon]